MRPVFLLSVCLLAGCAGPPPVGDVPASVPQPELKSGDQWTYQVRDGYNHGLLRTLRYTVASRDGPLITLRVDDLRDQVASRTTETVDQAPVQQLTPRSLTVVSYAPAYPAYEFPLAAGRHWRREYAIEQPNGKPVHGQVLCRIVGWERVSVPAGEFNALRIERQSYLDDEEFWRWGTRGYETDWYAPEVGRFVRHEDWSEYYEKSGRWPNNIRRNDWTVLELTAYRTRQQAAAD